MEIYETEEQQVEAIKRWWKENNQMIFIGATLGISIIFGWNFWQDHKKDQALQASALYTELTKKMDIGQNDSSEKLAERLEKDFSGTDYAVYASLMDAKGKIQHNDIAGAKQLLEKVATVSNNELSNLAKIRLVRLMLANKEYEQGLKLINEVDPASTKSFAGHYDELVGDLYVALDRVDQARTSYQNALRNGLQSALLQMKIDDLTAPEKVESSQ